MQTFFMLYRSNNQKRTNVMSKSDGLLRNNLKEADELFHQKKLELEVKKRYLNFINFIQ
jgi:hypothetical protein